MDFEYLIIGQGIAGTLLSNALWKQGRSFLVIDNVNGTAKASVVAGAIINPVNVSRWTSAPQVGSIVNAALETYKNFEETLGCSLIEETSMLVFHEDLSQSQLFVQQQLISQIYLPPPVNADIQIANRFFNDAFGLAKVQPVWKINATALLSGWAAFLQREDLLLKEHFDIDRCRITPEAVTYKSTRFKKIIFCEGASGALNPFFKQLPFTKNRGEALLLSIPGLAPDYIYHHGIRLVPTATGLFWCGSNYQWSYRNLSPDQNWRKKTEIKLRQWLTVPFEVMDHLVAERPTTAGQVFLAGVHPGMPSVAIFNGLGTKGFSYGPALAN
ncbi:MAG TPA: FAD-dependent oxidoreductase, partial [Agriterribacter sp.]|nr:FAD-dependent oxidoreductase [Agriterribacter sp.]